MMVPVRCQHESCSGRPATEPAEAGEAAATRSGSANRLLLIIVCAGLMLVAAATWLLIRDGAPAVRPGQPGATESGHLPRRAAAQAGADTPAVPPIATHSRTEPPESPPARPPAPKPARLAPGKLPARPARPPEPLAWRLDEFGLTVPARATVIEVDGVRLRVRRLPELVRRGNLPLILPKGRHVVRFDAAAKPQVVQPRRWFADFYREAVAQMQVAGRWDFDRLLEQSRLVLEQFDNPLVPHFWGNYYWQEGELAAAARHYRWALQIAPTFAPSYYNLALVAQQQGQAEAAGHYLHLAELWNVQNAFGLSACLHQLRTALGPARRAAEPPQDWLPETPQTLSRHDRDMIAVLRTAAAFEPDPRQRLKIMNNLGAYFEYVGKPELAVQRYRMAFAGLDRRLAQLEDRRLAHAILSNLARACQKGNMVEYRRYERLRDTLQP